MSQYTETKLAVYEAYRNGEITEDEKNELLYTLENSLNESLISEGKHGSAEERYLALQDKKLEHDKKQFTAKSNMLSNTVINRKLKSTESYRRSLKREAKDIKNRIESNPYRKDKDLMDEEDGQKVPDSYLASKKKLEELVKRGQLAKKKKQELLDKHDAALKGDLGFFKRISAHSSKSNATIQQQINELDEEINKGDEARQRLRSHKNEFKAQFANPTHSQYRKRLDVPIHKRQPKSDMSKKLLKQDLRNIKTQSKEFLNKTIRGAKKSIEDFQNNRAKRHIEKLNKKIDASRV